MPMFSASSCFSTTEIDKQKENSKLKKKKIFSNIRKLLLLNNSLATGTTMNVVSDVVDVDVGDKDDDDDDGGCCFLFLVFIFFFNFF